MNVCKRGRSRKPGRRPGGRWRPGPAMVRAAVAGAAAAVLFGALAAIGLAAGAALTAGPTSPSLPPALAPTREAVPDGTAVPGSGRTALLTNGARVATITSGLRVGGPGRHPAQPPGHGQRPGRQCRSGRASHGHLNGALRDGDRSRKGGGPRWPAALRNARMEGWLGLISTGRSTSAT